MTRAGNWPLVVPSFWGSLTWTAALIVLYIIDIGWYPPGWYAVAILTAMGTSFLASFALFSQIYRSYFDTHYDAIFPTIRLRWVLLLHAAGVASCALFIHDMNASAYLPGDFLDVLISDPLEIRKVPLDDLSRGIYLNYFAWVASFISGTQAAKRPGARPIHFALVFIQIVASLVFLSKVRPIIVLFLFVLPYLILSRKRASALRLGGMATVLAAMVAGFFLVWSDTTGKTFDLGIGYPPAIETFFLYLTSGPAYLSHIIYVEAPDFSPARILRPFYTLSALLIGTTPPPSAITPFYDLPITTNVGTGLEPWFRDLGGFGILLGIFVLSFGVDLIAYWGLLFGRITGFMVSIVMCMCSALCFFAPRLTTGPVAGILLVFVLHVLAVSSWGLLSPIVKDFLGLARQTAVGPDTLNQALPSKRTTPH